MKDEYAIKIIELLEEIKKELKDIEFQARYTESNTSNISSKADEADNKLNAIVELLKDK